MLLQTFITTLFDTTMTNQILIIEERKMKRRKKKVRNEKSGGWEGNLKGNEQKNCLFNSSNIVEALQFNSKRK